MSVFITLTTVPLRLKTWESFKITLYSLLNQKTNIDYKVILNLPTAYKVTGEIINETKELLECVEQNKEKLIINRCNDFGATTKLIGSLNLINNPNDIMIVLDDDHEYENTLLEYQLKKFNQYNQSVATCFRGDMAYNMLKRENRYCYQTADVLFPVNKDVRVIIPAHWHSVCYKRSFFNTTILNEEFLSLSDNDDYLIGYYLRKNNIPLVCVNWEHETDYTPVNFYRGSHSFPVKQQLAHELSGCFEFRKIAGNHRGRVDQKLAEFLIENSNYYLETDEYVSLTPELLV